MQIASYWSWEDLSQLKVNWKKSDQIQDHTVGHCWKRNEDNDARLGLGKNPHFLSKGRYRLRSEQICRYSMGKWLQWSSHKTCTFENSLIFKQFYFKLQTCWMKDQLEQKWKWNKLFVSKWYNFRESYSTKLAAAWEDNYDATTKLILVQ